MNWWPLLLGIAIGLVLIGIPLLFLRKLFWQFAQGFLAYQSMIEDLRKRGERVNATITDIHASNASSSRPVYTLSAEWFDPKTGQTHTFTTRIPDPDKFPIGSSVVFLLDPNDPNFNFPQFLLEQKDS